MEDTTTQSTFEQIAVLAKSAGAEGEGMLAVIELASRRLFNRPFKTLADELDRFGTPLTLEQVKALITAGKFEAATHRGQSTARVGQG